MLGLCDVRLFRRADTVPYGLELKFVGRFPCDQIATVGRDRRRFELAILGEHALGYGAVLTRTLPEPGQESCWDYPRPPLIEASSREIVVACGGVEIARSRHAVRVLETYGAPVYYVPTDDVVEAVFRPSGHQRTVCEWKGAALYFDLVCEESTINAAAWSYPEPAPEYRKLAGYFSFFPDLVDCYVDGERASAQPAGFDHNYGGWVTDEIVGPMKGEPGTQYW